MPQRSFRLLILVVGCLAATALSGCGRDFVDSSPGRSTAPVNLGWNQVDPIKVELPTADPVGGNSTAPDLAGPLLVNLWASWCEPCKAELPLLQKISAEGKLQVIGFTRDHRAANATKALTEAGVVYPNWMDPEARFALALDGRVPINAVPSSVLIRDGKVVAVHIGEFKTHKDVYAGLTEPTGPTGPTENDELEKQ